MKMNEFPLQCEYKREREEGVLGFQLEIYFEILNSRSPNI